MIPAIRTQTANGPRVVWDPQKDITTHELAVALNLLIRIGAGALAADLAVKWLDEFPPKVRRHFKVETPE